MRVHFGIDQVAAEWHDCTVCIGTFDGVHLGHQQLIKAAVAQSRVRQHPSVCITFDRHPFAVLRPNECPPAIGTLEQNVIALRQLGLSATVIMPFTQELSQMSAQEFLSGVIRHPLRASHTVVGYDFAFGKGREGTAAWLSERIPTHIEPPFLIDEQRVSSSTIRELIQGGSVEKVSKLLGRHFSLAGVVIKGQQLGRQIGFPTLNLARTSMTCIPADGIYAGICELQGRLYKAAISVGWRPTVGGQSRTIEAFLIDYPGDEVYGAAISLAFHQFLRPEEQFDSLERLSKQIHQDVEQTKVLVEVQN